MKLPAMIPVESSNLHSVGHSADGLFIRFKGGGMYRYPEAPLPIYTELLQAESPGSVFRSKVAGKFHHVKHDA